MDGNSLGELGLMGDAVGCSFFWLGWYGAGYFLRWFARLGS